MMYVVHELPDHVELSPNLRDRAEFYLCVQSFGISYYIPATPRIRRLLMLDKQGKDAKPDQRLRWWRMDKGEAVRDIIQSLELQVRDVVLAGIEQNVTHALLERMEAVMQPTVHGLVAKQATKKLLENVPAEQNQQQTKEEKTK
jgi:sulfite reductase alpha subunit-like flavoprotein